MNSIDDPSTGRAPTAPAPSSGAGSSPSAYPGSSRGTHLRRLEDDLVAIVGRSNVLADADMKGPYEVDWTRRFSGRCAFVVRPGSTEEVSVVLRECTARGVAVVPQGGNTGLVGGGVPPDESADSVLLSTRRLDRLQPIDRLAGQVTVGAGVTLASLQAAAAVEGLAFPVDLAARDSATLGGMIATNAGGLHVIRYGPMRSRVVGLEAVLSDGTVISHLSGLLKDNTGYDLSQLLIGSEGTLAVITAARLTLVPETPERIVVLVGLASTADAVAAIEILRRDVQGLQAAEVFFEDGLELVRSHARLGQPLKGSYPVYLLVEAAGRADCSDEMFNSLVELGVEEDATAVAVDTASMAALWEYRERHTEAVSALGIPHKLDVTLPHSRLADFEAEIRRLVASESPSSRLVLFGHVGDGNLHVNIVGPPPSDESIDERVLQLVAAMGGSISAEHGIGRAKARWLHLSRSATEIAAMHAIKSALDPTGTLNPAVLFDRH